MLYYSLLIKCDCNFSALALFLLLFLHSSLSLFYSYSLLLFMSSTISDSSTTYELLASISAYNCPFQASKLLTRSSISLHSSTKRWFSSLSSFNLFSKLTLSRICSSSPFLLREWRECSSSSILALRREFSSERES